MFCEPEAPCENHRTKEKKKAASRGTSKKKSPAAPVDNLPSTAASPTVTNSVDLKAAMKAAAASAPTQTDIPSNLPKPKRTKETGEMGLITLDPIQKSPARSRKASPAQVDARASMRESARSTEQMVTDEHDELIGCIAVLAPILHPEELKPYRSELWKRRNRA